MSKRRVPKHGKHGRGYYPVVLNDEEWARIDRTYRGNSFSVEDGYLTIDPDGEMEGVVTDSLEIERVE